MPKTGAHLKIKSYGDAALGVELEGNPNKPEPPHFRVAFPGGDVDIARCDDGSYWIHVRVNHPDHDPIPDEQTARVINGRLDIHGKSTSENNMGDFGDPNLYHVAIRVKPL